MSGKLYWRQLWNIHTKEEILPCFKCEARLQYDIASARTARSAINAMHGGHFVAAMAMIACH